MRDSRSSNSDFSAVYGFLSLITIMSLIFVFGISFAAIVAERRATIAVADAQARSAEAYRDAAVGVAQAEQSGMTDRTAITEATKVRLHWTYLPDRILRLAVGAMIAMLVLFIFVNYVKKLAVPVEENTQEREL